MEVKLLHHTPLSVAVIAIRQCYDSGEKSDSFYPDVSPHPYFSLGQKDKKLLETIVKDGHGSTLEHLTMNFQIKGISRLVLQELARHRIASYSVKSSRYTLKELKNEKPFQPTFEDYKERAFKYINSSGDQDVDYYAIKALENLRNLVYMGVKNDIAKYAVPESYKVDLVMSINVRSLINLLELRLSHRAHYEIQELAQKIKETIPNQYKFLFEINSPK